MSNNNTAHFVGADDDPASSSQALIVNNNLNLHNNMTIQDRVDQKFEEIGGFGKFQVFAYIAISFGMNS